MLTPRLPLLAALRQCQAISQQPVKVGLAFNGPSLTLTATAVPISYRSSLTYSGDPLDPFAVDCDLFLAAAEAIQGEEIAIAIKSPKMTLSGKGTRKATVGILSADHVPGFPLVEVAEPAVIHAGHLASVLKRTSFAMYSGADRANIHGLFLSLAGTKLDSCAFDGYRAAYASTEAQETAPLSTFVPHRCVRALEALLADLGKQDEVMVSASQSRVTFSASGTELACLLCEGQSAMMVINHVRGGVSFELPRGPILDAARAIAKAAGDRMLPIRVRGDGSTITIAGADIEESIEGSQVFDLTLKAKYFAESLGVIEGDTVRVYAGVPAGFEALDGSTCACVSPIVQGAVAAEKTEGKAAA